MRYAILVLLVSAAFGEVRAQQTSGDSVATESTNYITRENLQTFPVRSVQQALGTLPGVEWQENTSTVYVQSQAGSNIKYYWNGIPLAGDPILPFDLIQSIQLHSNHVPAKYGGGASGIVDVSTVPHGEITNRISVQGLTSGRFDEFGYRLGSATGLFSLGRDGSFITAAAEWQDEPFSSAFELASLKPDVRQRLEDNPQLVVVRTSSGPRVAMEMPDGIGVGSSVTELETALGLGQGDIVETVTPAHYYITNNDLQFDHFTPFGKKQLRASAQLRYPINSSVTLWGAGSFESADEKPYLHTYSLFNESRGLRTQSDASQLSGGIQSRFDNTLLNGTIFFASDGATTHNALFSSDIEDQFHYGDLDHPANAFFAQLLEPDTDNDELVRLYNSGNIGEQKNPSQHPIPHDSYSRSDDNYLASTVDASFALGRHNLSAGWEFSSDSQRLWSQSTEGISFFNASRFDSVTSYSEIAPIRFDHTAFFYGYNFRGDEKADVSALGEDRNPGTEVPLITRSIAIYGADRYEFSEWSLSVGIRATSFRNNQRALWDPHSLFPIVRAGDLTEQVPAGIRDDFAVYFDEASKQITGFRNRSGDFFDVSGRATESSDVTTNASPEVVERTFVGYEEVVFEDSRNYGVVDPRVHVQFDPGGKFSLSGSVSRLSAQPLGQLVVVPINEYKNATERNHALGNPNLKPIRTFRATVGAAYAPTQWLSLHLAAWHQEVKNLPGQRSIGSFPGSYWTTVSEGEVSTNKLMAGLDIESAAYSIKANYTFDRSIEFTRLPVITWRVPDIFASGPAPLARRHTVDFLASASTGSRSSGVRRLLNNSCGTFYLTAASGRPYTAVSNVSPFYTSFNGFLEGGLNAQRMPAMYRVDLRLEKGFNLGQSSTFSVFFWGMNLLGARNVYQVYGQTGSPATDDYLLSPLGMEQVGAVNRTSGPTAAQGFQDQYNIGLRNPAHVGIPRQIRFGVRVEL